MSLSRVAARMCSGWRSTAFREVGLGAHRVAELVDAQLGRR